jgi:hypothetical protein
VEHAAHKDTSAFSKYSQHGQPQQPPGFARLAPMLESWQCLGRAALHGFAFVGAALHKLVPGLLTQVDSEGRKFGKSTGGAIWLSAEKLSPYKFYQYLFQVCVRRVEAPGMPALRAALLCRHDVDCQAFSCCVFVSGAVACSMLTHTTACAWLRWV